MRGPGWYLVDYVTLTCVRGPFLSAEAAEAVRREIEGDRNIWVVAAETLSRWEADAVEARQ